MKKIILSCFLSFIIVVSYTQSGALDLGFNHTGKAVTILPDSSSIHALAIQADGKIIAAGSNYSGIIHRFALARYDASGTLDSLFGTNGIVITSINHADDIYAVVLQNDGKILVAGSCYNGTVNAFALARYNNNGSLDVSFGAAHTGIDTNSFGGFNTIVYALALQNNGQIIVAGKSNEGSAIARYNNNGSLDSSFGNNGISISYFGGHVDEAAKAVAIQNEWKDYYNRA